MCNYISEKTEAKKKASSATLMRLGTSYCAGQKYYRDYCLSFALRVSPCLQNTYYSRCQQNRRLRSKVVLAFAPLALHVFRVGEIKAQDNASNENALKCRALMEATAFTYLPRVARIKELPIFFLLLHSPQKPHGQISASSPCISPARY